MASFYHILSAPIVNHIKLLHRLIDPIETRSSSISSLDSGERRRPNSAHFIFPILIILFTATYGTLFLHYQAGGQLDLASLRDSPYIFPHQVMPPNIWAQIDFGFGIDVLIAPWFYYTLARMPDVRAEFKMYQIGESVWIGARGKWTGG